MLAYQERLLDEKTELDMKISRLEDRIQQDRKSQLRDEYATDEFYMMQVQLNHMEKYSMLLQHRIDLWEEL